MTWYHRTVFPSLSRLALLLILILTLSGCAQCSGSDSSDGAPSGAGSPGETIVEPSSMPEPPTTTPAEDPDNTEYFQVLEEYSFQSADWQWSIGQNLKGQTPVEHAVYEEQPDVAPFYSASHLAFWTGDQLEVRAGVVEEGAIDPILFMATESDTVSTFRNISVGDSAEDLTAAYPQNLYYDCSADYYVPDENTIGFRYDKAYIFAPADHSNRHIQFFLYQDTIVRIEMADLLESRLVNPEATPTERPNVESAYAKADEAYAWFDLESMPCDESDTVEYDGYLYARVTHETIRSMDDLRAYLKTLFLDEFVSQLLREGEPFQPYRDWNGVLYTVAAGRGTDITKGKATGKVMYESLTQVQYYVTVEILDPNDDFSVTGKETHEFLYQYVGDGRWGFHGFQSVR